MEMDHTGVVTAVRQDEVDVTVTVQSACAGCSSRSRCFGSGSSSERTVTVACDGTRYRPGQQVRVAICRHAATRAVVLCYVVPLVVLVAAVFAGVECGAGEPMAAVVAIAATGAYYALLWMVRGRIERKINFKIK